MFTKNNSNQGAWQLDNGMILSIHEYDDGYDYTLYHPDLTEFDGGQLDNPEFTLKEARDEILNSFSLADFSFKPIDYEQVEDLAETVSMNQFKFHQK